MAQSKSPEHPENVSKPGMTNLDKCSGSHEAHTKGSDESFEMYCETCNRDGERKTANAFCTTCMTYFCSNCLKFHGKFLPGHKYSEGKDMPQDICMEKCQTHVNEIIKFYCERCKTVVCLLCKTEEHADTCTVKYLPDLLQNLETWGEFNELKSNKIKIEKRLSDTSREIETRHKRIHSIVKEASSSVQKAKNKFFSKLDGDVSKMDEKIQSLEKKDNSQVGFVKDQLESFCKESDLLSENIEKMSTLSISQGCKLFMKLKQQTYDLNKIKDSIENLKKECFKNKDALEDELKLQMKFLTENIKELESKASQAGNVEQNVANVPIQTACFVYDINVRTKGDEKDCDISDCCLLSKKYLVACDRANCSLKLIDMNRKKIVCVRPVRTSPFAVSTVSETQIVMVQPFERNTDKSIIQFLTVTAANQLKFLKSSFLTEMFCYDIAYVRNERLIVSMSLNHEGKVQILTMKGEVIANIEDNKEGNLLFRCPYAITMDAEQERLYVSDWYKDVITEINMSTQQNRMIPHTFWHPGGITMSAETYVCVFEEGTGRVHILDPTDSSSCILIEKQSEKWDPCSVCFSATDSTLYLGQNELDVIKVYKVSNCLKTKK